MNAKKVKALRRMLKAYGINVKDTAYDVREHKRTAWNGKTVYYRYQILLAEHCGRKAYKQAKKGKR